VGEAAKQELSSNPSNTAFDIKRLIGRNYWDKSVQQDIKKFPFRVVNQRNSPAVKLQDRIYSPEQISAILLKNLKESAESYLGEPVEVCIYF
jgi:heat shock protein 5